MMRAEFGMVMAAALAACAQVPEPAPLAGSAARDTVFNLAPGGRVNIFSGTPSSAALSHAPARDWPTFRVCRTDETPDSVTLAIGPLDRVGPRHPDIHRIEVAPGSCYFVSGPMIEAVGAPYEFSILVLSNTGGGDAGEAQKKAQAWLTSRIAALEAEPQSAARDMLLAELGARATGVLNGSPAAQLAVTLVTPEPTE